MSLGDYRERVRSEAIFRSGDTDYEEESLAEEYLVDEGLDFGRAFVMRKYGQVSSFSEIADSGLELLDLGKEDLILYYGIVGTDYMIKYYEDSLLYSDWMQVERDLVGSELVSGIGIFAEVLYVGDDFVLMERVSGRSLYDVLVSGDCVNPGWVRKVSEGLDRLGEQCGLYGHRVSLGDVYVTDLIEDNVEGDSDSSSRLGEVRVRVLDISHGRSDRVSLLWEEVQRLYDRFYGRGILPLSWRRKYFRYRVSRLR